MKKNIFILLTAVLVLHLFSLPAQAAGQCVDLKKTLKLNSKGTSVSTLQNFLVAEGYSNLLIRGSVTGTFARITKKAIADFQQQHELPVTGEADIILRTYIAKVTGCNESITKDIKNSSQDVKLDVPNTEGVSYEVGQTYRARVIGTNVGGMPVRISLIATSSQGIPALIEENSSQPLTVQLNIKSVQRNVSSVVTTSVGTSTETFDFLIPKSLPEGYFNMLVSIINKNGKTVVQDYSDFPIKVNRAPALSTSSLPYVKIIAPLGGDEWTKGQVQNIRWETEGAAKSLFTVSLVNSTTKQSYVIDTNAKNIGRLNASIDALASVIPGKYKLQIIGRSGSIIVQDMSDEFTIIDRDGTNPVVTAAREYKTGRSEVNVGAQIVVIGSNFTFDNNSINIRAEEGTTTSRAIVGLNSSDRKTVIFTLPQNACTFGTNECITFETGHEYEVSLTNKNGTSDWVKSFSMKSTVASTSTTPRSLELISPNGGQTLVKTLPTTVTWHAVGMSDVTPLSINARLVTFPEGKLENKKISTTATRLATGLNPNAGSASVNISSLVQGHYIFEVTTGDSVDQSDIFFSVYDK